MSLELGGKSPNIVCKDADLEVSTARGRERDLFQPRPALGSRRLPALRREGYLRRGGGGRGEGPAKKIKVGPGVTCVIETGPSVSDEQQRRVLGYLESGFSEGAKAVVGGRELGDKGYFVEPTVRLIPRRR